MPARAQADSPLEVEIGHFKMLLVWDEILGGEIFIWLMLGRITEQDRRSRS